MFFGSLLELSRKVIIDLKTDADFRDRGFRPVHVVPLSICALTRLLLTNFGPLVPDCYPSVFIACFINDAKRLGLARRIESLQRWLKLERNRQPAEG